MPSFMQKPQKGPTWVIHYLVSLPRLFLFLTEEIPISELPCIVLELELHQSETVKPIFGLQYWTNEEKIVKDPKFEDQIYEKTPGHEVSRENVHTFVKTLVDSTETSDLRNYFMWNRDCEA